VFVVLAARLIIDKQLGLYVLLKDVEQSMKNASDQDAACVSFFVFRSTSIKAETENQPKLLKADEIIDGSEEKDGFEGMVPLLKEYVAQIPDLSTKQRRRLLDYLDFVSLRANGATMSTAVWVRDQLVMHADYRAKRDSLVSQAMVHGLIQACIEEPLFDPSSEEVARFRDARA
jgi:glutamate--cysteine ligase catalytic subunit